MVFAAEKESVYWKVKVKVKVKVIPQQAEVAQGVPGGLRSRIFLTFGTTRVVGRQPYAPSAFTPGEIPGIHFQRLSRPQGIWFLREPRKKSPVTPPGIDPGISRLVAQWLNRYANPDPSLRGTNRIFKKKIVLIFIFEVLKEFKLLLFTTWFKIWELCVLLTRCFHEFL